MWKVLPMLREVILQEDDVLYYKGDNAEEFYFITNGTIKLHCMIDGIKTPFIQYSKGETIGDSDALLDLPRDSMAVGVNSLTLRALTTVQFEHLFTNSQDTCLKMIVDARQKRDSHMHAIERKEKI
jgi:CRP-like cAMP-binding protein